MAYNYDKLYGTTAQALGAPTQVIVDFFERQTSAPLLRVLDVGCGQGRDALFIARLGHSVVGVDLSSNGIRDLVLAANKENLAIEGIAANITTFKPEGVFDVVLIDRTLHMLPETDQIEVLERLIGLVPKRGWVLIADERSNMPRFKGVFDTHIATWSIKHDARSVLFLQRS